MGLLIILFVLAAAGVVALMYLRPPAKTRFRNAERAELAARIERIAHIVLGVTFVSMILFGIGRSPSAILRLLWLVLILGGFAAFAALAHYVASRVHVTGLSRPGEGPAPPPAPERREPTTRQPGAERRSPASRTRPEAGSQRPDGPAGERKRPPDRPAPKRPSGSDDRPRPRTRPRPEGGPAGPEASAGRGPQPPPRPRRAPEDRPATDRPPADRPTTDPEAPRRPNPSRPPGLRRPNPIPPEPESARARSGDKANHEAAPDDPTELGGLP